MPRSTNKNNIGDYLVKFTQPEVARAHQFLKTKNLVWQTTVVIPARREKHLQNLFSSLSKAANFHLQRVLAILVVNGNADDYDANQGAIEELVTAYPQLVNNEEFILLAAGSYLNILIVTQDRPGVGQARKLGCDIALSLINDQKIFDNWIRTTDADVEVPKDYFNSIDAVNAGAVVFPFTHHPFELDEIQTSALKIYESWLKYYVRGLEFAKSPFAYHSIGSTLAIESFAYATVRGFPDRDAGEDFYLLDKIAKFKRVLQLNNRLPLKIQGRKSDRVPFGTGPGMQSLAEQLKKNQIPQFYNPLTFLRLRDLLSSFESFANQASDQLVHFEPALKSLGLSDFLNQLESQSPDPRIRSKAIHQKFDALKTLQFVHWVRDNWHPTVDWSLAVQALVPGASLDYSS